jgi:hypothetical protein
MFLYTLIWGNNVSDNLEKLICCNNKKMKEVGKLTESETDPWYRTLYQCQDCKKVAIYKTKIGWRPSGDKEEVDSY